MPRQMDCTASGKGNEKKRQGWYGFIKSGSDDDDEDGKSGRKRKKRSKQGEERSLKKIGCQS